MRNLALFLALVVLLLPLGCRKKYDPGKQVNIRGSGASFPEPLYKQWIVKYNQQTKNQVTYRSIGSGKGIRAISMDAVDFAGSDVPMTDDQLAQAGDILHIPMTVGAVAIVYDITGAPDGLKFGPSVLEGIFTGEIESWNDERIAADNSGVNLPDLPIQVVYRSDRSGTTYLFTDYLAQVSPEFRKEFGASMEVEWPVGTGQDGNRDLAGMVQKTEGAIGYVALNYARAMSLRVGEVKNKAGQWVKPSLDTVTAAATNAAGNMPPDLRTSLVYTEGRKSYPITGFSYALVRKNAVQAPKGRAVAHFLMWGLDEGQRYAPVNHYATLPPEVVAKAKERLRSMTVNGEPVLVATK